MSSQPTAEVIANAGVMRIQGLPVKVVSYEDLLFAKRESGRAKDRIDAVEFARIHGNGERT